jgi:hypothetical protein
LIETIDGFIASAGGDLAQALALLEGQVDNTVIADNTTARSSEDYLHRRSPADLEPSSFR